MNNPPSQRARELSEEITDKSFYYVINRPDNYKERLKPIVTDLIQQALAAYEAAQKRKT